MISECLILAILLNRTTKGRKWDQWREVQGNRVEEGRAGGNESR